MARTTSRLLPAALVLCAACTYDIPALVDADAGDGGGAGSGSGSGGQVIEGGSDAQGTDASMVTDTGGAEAPVEGGSTEGTAPCTGIGCTCVTSASCASDVCAGSETVGAAVYAAAGGRSFCTKTCCTSADCDAGTVCFASGQGGSYCVSPSWLGRSAAPGTAKGGATCSAGTDCRSGLCSTSSGKCADTCCSLADSETECVAPEQCVFGAFPGVGSLDDHLGGICAAATGGAAYSAQCTTWQGCAGGLCFQNGCTNPCHSPTECGTGNACELAVQDGDVIMACFPTPGTAPLGTSCNSDSVCRGNWCNQSNQCSNVCFTDADCASASGWRCLPQPDTLPGVGSYLVLACALP